MTNRALQQHRRGGVQSRNGSSKIQLVRGRSADDILVAV